VALARALVGNPTLLLADEPTGNLDSGFGNEILGLIGRLHHEGSTIVMITHDPTVAARAGRQLRLHDGWLLTAPTRRPREGGSEHERSVQPVADRDERV
jgi:putative ABC transport system ATP-binding protein